MSKTIFQFIFALILVSSTQAVWAATQNGNQTSTDQVWSQADDAALSQRRLERAIVPDQYKTFALNKTALRTILNRAPREFSDVARNEEVLLTLPMPDGKFTHFRLIESSVMAPELAAKFPEIKTYVGQGIEDPTATGRISISPSGFRAMILSKDGTVVVDPYAKGDTTNYISYRKADIGESTDFKCLFDDEAGNHVDFSAPTGFETESPNLVINGNTLRVYRLALAATAEYVNVFRKPEDTDAQAKARALEQQVLIMNRVNGVYERDLAVRMVLIANNDSLIYTDAATDPYTNNSGSTMLGQNQTNIDTVIGSANYDIGHVFSTGGGGVASLRVPCSSTSKARGVTGLTNPVGDPFAIDYVAHEIGHQFGANHTFNGSVGSCAGGNRSAGAAYETGSGITIMAYAGICGNQDLARNSIDTFHVRSLEEIIAFISNTATGGSCPVATATNNTAPTITPVGGNTFNIPKNTPFALTALATDTEGDSITYDWQQYDLGAATTAVPNTDSDGVAKPITRPYLPTASGTRVFPSLQYILNNANVPPATYSCGRTTPCLTGEILPSIARTMNFQAIARDNRANGGGINTASVQVVVSGTSGPFQVTAPNTATTWRVGSSQTITWDVAGTTEAPISVSAVRILLSTDGGQTFPTILRGGTPNDGSETVVVPNVSTTTARIKIEALDNIFFDISDVNFAISNAPVFVRPAKFDFDGDAKSDVSVFRPTDGTWYLLRSTAGFTAQQFGASGDKTVPADFDGDGRTDVAVYRSGNWFIINSSNNQFRAVQFGVSTDTPVPADYDGDGKADIAVFRGGNWYYLSSLNNQFVAVQFGIASDKPVPADYDGDGKTDVAVYREGTWYLLRSQAGFTAVQFGNATDKPIVGDYDGDGKADQAVYRDGIWYLLRSQTGFTTVQFGNATDVPTAADYDGDGKTDVAVFRDGNWYLLGSTSGFSAVQFGNSTDKAVPASFVP